MSSYDMTYSFFLRGSAEHYCIESDNTRLWSGRFYLSMIIANNTNRVVTHYTCFIVVIMIFIVF